MTKFITYVLMLLSMKALWAVPLNDESLSKIAVSSIIGVFSVTFDPPTNEHKALIDAALAAKHFSHILVIPADANMLKPKALAPSIRYAFVKAAFLNDERVLYADFEHFHDTASAVHYLKEKGFITMGVVLQSDLDHWFTGVAMRFAIAKKLPVDKWLVSAVSESRFSWFPITIYFQNRMPLIRRDPQSSEKVRKYFKEQRPSLEHLKDSILPVPYPVAELILKHNLYLP